MLSATGTVSLGDAGFFEGIGLFIKTQFLNIGLFDIIDVLVLAGILFAFVSLLRDRKGGRLIIGVIVCFLILAVSGLFRLEAVNFIFRFLMGNGIVVFIIIFQPELRYLLDKLSGSMFGIKNWFSSSKHEVDPVIRSVSRAAFEISQKGGAKGQAIGALIVLERTGHNDDLYDGGVVIDARVDAGLIRTIFFDQTPLHDGAIVIRDGRIYIAHCKLQCPDIGYREFGMRHRSAVGVSSASDAVVVVVSEETRTISLAVGGNIERGLDEKQLRARLETLLAPSVTGTLIDSEEEIASTAMGEEEEE